MILPLDRIQYHTYNHIILVTTLEDILKNNISISFTSVVFQIEMKKEEEDRLSGV